MRADENISGKKADRFHKYLDYASVIIAQYKGNEPFHLFLKKYFSVNKKHGSNDRRQIGSLCYYYFRLGLGVRSDVSMKQRFLIGVFLMENEPSPLLDSLTSSWNQKIKWKLFEKLAVVKELFNADLIFPLSNELSKEINSHLLNISVLMQPRLFIRIRPGFQAQVVRKLIDAGIPFNECFDGCFSFANQEKISQFITLDKEAVIQDLNSQRVGEFFKSFLANRQSQITDKAERISVWDCCAASGGKSILAQDILKNVSLTVSDVRSNILKNLEERFAKAGITKYQSFVADLSLDPRQNIFENTGIKTASFDLIIADVPCSGSGTWSRTPEEIQRFSDKQLTSYSALQKKIVTNASRYLKKSGFFLYVTCSVYKKENEENIQFIENNLGLKLVKARYLVGYEKQADTLFAAMFRKV
jgi:16S rRNA (cytosine967-C5)-methyltransferase